LIFKNNYPNKLHKALCKDFFSESGVYFRNREQKFRFHLKIETSQTADR